MQKQPSQIDLQAQWQALFEAELKKCGNAIIAASRVAQKYPDLHRAIRGR